MTHRFDFILLSHLSVLCSIWYTSATMHMFMICSPQIIKWWSKFIFTYKNRGLGQAKPEPSREWRLWPGLRFEEAKAASGQAKAGAFRPSRAGTALPVSYWIGRGRQIVLSRYHIRGNAEASLHLKVTDHRCAHNSITVFER